MLFDSKISHASVSAHPTPLLTLFSVFSPVLSAVFSNFLSVLTERNITAGMLAIISGTKELNFKSGWWLREPG